jgi:hypothetical protein
MGSTQDPRLHVAGEEVQEWVTLSHCWGQNQPLRTTTQTLARHQQSLSMNELPSLFQDAVTITRSLGFRYLWIDSLCIVQDSKVDWTREISKMGSIYKNSVLTICADNCRDSTENALGNHIPIETKYVQQGCHSTKDGFKSMIHTFDEDEWQQRQTLLGYLRTRAWGLQEQILSPRTLQWTPLQMVWGCR